jgi:hypothetical protein
MMTQKWIVQVEGREYGPAELPILREWKEEGRVLPTNQVRRAETNTWIQAAEIPGLFESVLASSEPSLPRPREQRRFGELLGETLRIFRNGLFQYVCLTLLVIVPSACAQLTGAVLDNASAVDADLRTLLAGSFAFCLVLVSLALWPVYISGIQLLTNEIQAGRRPGFFSVLNEAVRLWPRVALLALFVYGSYLFWTILPVGLILIIALGAPSLGSFFLGLLLLAFQVWIVGRLYVNFMFWQQFAVLAGNDAAEALRNSKTLARGHRDVVWYKRPLWRGVFIFSLWFLVVLGLNLPLVWTPLQIYFHELTVSQDVQHLVQTLTAYSKSHGANVLHFVIGLVQALLRPMLGIAFVLLYLDATAPISEGDNNRPDTKL